ncbi:MAG: S49 family peptidase [Chlamydiales bacterium]
MTPPRESIFHGMLRSFFSSFGAILGILIGIVVVVFVFVIFSPSALVPEKTELSIAPDANGKREMLPQTAPVLLRINIHGVIGEPLLDSDTIENILLDSRAGMLEQGRVKGILLHVNTPGGTVADADNIYRALKEYKQKYKVPIYVFVDGLCASGGMYISSACDKIYATPSSVVGSVGVILGPTFNFSTVMDKIGVQSLTITQGKDKDELNPFRPWKPDEGKSIRDITASLYERFVTIVTEGRPALSKEKLVSDYGAQVFIASIAKEHGYIDDADADYSKALTELAVAANISSKQPYQVFELAPKLDFLTELTRSKFSFLSGRITHLFQIGPNMSSEMSGKFLYLYQAMTNAE